MNMAVTIDKLTQSAVANLKSFKGSTGLSNTPHHQDYRKDMVWGQFNRTFTSVGIALGP